MKPITSLFFALFAVLILGVSGCDMDMGGMGGLNLPAPWKASVVITSPATNDTVSGQVVVQVAVSNGTADETNVFLWVDGNMNEGSVIFPSVDWFTGEVKNGTHTIQAEAYVSQNGNTGIANYFWSDPVTVIVRN